MKDEELNQQMTNHRLEQKKMIAKSIFDYLPRTKQDFVIAGAIVALILIWIADLFIPDPLPFVDEILLPMLTYLIAQWYANRKSSDNSQE